MGTDFINSKNEFFNAEDFINEELKNEINEINLLISFSLKDKTMSPDDIKKRIYYILDNSACMSPDAKDVCLFSKAGDAGLLAFRRLAILSLEANAFQKALGQICSIIGLGECRLVTNGEGGSIVVNFKSEQFYNENQTLISPQDFVKHLQLNNMIVNKSKSCAKCGKEMNGTFGYRYCDQCGVIFYTCCDSHSYCPSCGRKVKQFKGNGSIIF